MNDKDPTTYNVPTNEAEANYNKDSVARLKAISTQIDQLLADDSEGTLKHSGHYPYPDSVEHKEAQIGERSDENVNRTTTEDGAQLYYVAYNTRIENPQPDSTQPYYNPLSTEPTYFDWEIGQNGEVSNFTKNAEPLTNEEQTEAAVTEVNRTIEEGFNKKTLTVEQYRTSRHENSLEEKSSAPSPVSPPPSARLGRLATKLDTFRK